MDSFEGARVCVVSTGISNPSTSTILKLPAINTRQVTLQPSRTKRLLLRKSTLVIKFLCKTPKSFKFLQKKSGI